MQVCKVTNTKQLNENDGNYSEQFSRRLLQITWISIFKYRYYGSTVIFRNSTLVSANW